jgi:hypothetical protein
MSATETKHVPAPLEDIDEIAARNPKVDAEQLREAQTLLKQLRDEGLERPSYGIASPYERRPLQRRATPRLQRTTL